MVTELEFLAEKTLPYRALIIDRSRDGQQNIDVKFSGLQALLSELNPKVSDNNAFLGIWADTLLVDTNQINTQALSIVARRVIVADGINELVISGQKSGDGPALAQLLIGSGTGAQTPPGQPSGNLLDYMPVARSGSLCAITLVQGPDGLFSQLPVSSKDAADLLGRSQAFNMVQAQFTAATELINLNVHEYVDEAKLRLQWIVDCIGIIGSDGQQIPAKFAEVYTQSYNILLTQNISGNSWYLPVLSGQYYDRQSVKLIEALEAYEKDYYRLTSSSDIRNAIIDISSNLERVSGLQRTPLKIDLDNIISNAENLGRSIQELRAQWDLNLLIAEHRWIKLYAAIRDANLKRYLRACFDTVVNVGKTAYGVYKIAGGSPTASIGDTLKSGLDVIKSVMAAQASATAEVKPDALVNSASTLAESQRALAESFIATFGIWNQLKNNKPITQWPISTSADKFDPDLHWNLYLIEAERVLTNLNQSNLIGTDDYSGGPQLASNDYFAMLKVLSQYGRAIQSKIISYTQLIASATKLKSELDANQNIQTTWENLSSKAQSEEERLAVLRALLKSRMRAINRSLYVSWLNFQYSYVYQYFQASPADCRISVEMNSRELREAFANLSSWIGNLMAPIGTRNKVNLPSQNVALKLTFPVVKNDSVMLATGPAAILTQSQDKKSWTISIEILKSSLDLKGIFPNRGDVAIWVDSANFFIKGAKPNSAGNVISTVSTSGTYVNGFSKNIMRFETHGVEGVSAYQHSSNKPYITWAINASTHVRPALFTQWTMMIDEEGGDPSVATEVDIDFKVSFFSTCNPFSHE